jgi:hypothetical protein
MTYNNLTILNTRNRSKSLKYPECYGSTSLRDTITIQQKCDIRKYLSITHNNLIVRGRHTLKHHLVKHNNKSAVLQVFMIPHSEKPFCEIKQTLISAQFSTILHTETYIHEIKQPINSVHSLQDIKFGNATLKSTNTQQC